MSDSEEEVGEKQLKIILLGNSLTGKTSLAMRLVHGEFCQDHKSTVGVDFFIKRILLSGDKSANIQIWDIGGSAISGTMIDKYIYGAHAALFVYDITNAKSFDGLKAWMETCNQMGPPTPHFALVANKCDLSHARVVSEDKHYQLAQDRGLSSHFVSAWTGEAVTLCFQRVAAEVFGIQLGRAEQDLASVMKAQVVREMPEDGSFKKQTTCASSKICSVQ